MATLDSRYRVNIGLSIVKQEYPGFADFGITYENMDYEKTVQVEAAFDRHADAILTAMKGLREELVAMGVMEAERIKEEVEKADKPARPTKR